MFKIKKIDAQFRAANYLTVAQIYLKNNPLLVVGLQQKDVKKVILGHWGTSSGLNFIYAHINRWIQDTRRECIFITGPGHGGPAIRANLLLEGAITAVYPDYNWTPTGLEKFIRDFSWPGGHSSHTSAELPGSIHEGGELGHSLAHATGAVMDNPNLTAVCVVGDGEAETGPLAASWKLNYFLNTKRDGAVLPILHANGYKISSPTIYGRMTDRQLRDHFKGLGYDPFIVKGKSLRTLHKEMFEALDLADYKLKRIKRRKLTFKRAPKYPLIILRSNKGMTGPKFVDGKKFEGSFRAHQVPFSDAHTNPEHFKVLEDWLKSYRPDKLFDECCKPCKKVLANIPSDSLKMGQTPFANGKKLRKVLEIPDIDNYKVQVKRPGMEQKEATREMGKLLRDIFKYNPDRFRLFCPDEAKSNRLDPIFENENRMYIGPKVKGDEALSSDGRVLEVLSEHLCQGWLEGYLLTGRHGILPTYEAFAMIVSSMALQHAKWLKGSKEISWREPTPSLNYLLTSHVWRQDHNGTTHRSPSFIDIMLQENSSVVNAYFPPDANSLLAVSDRCFRSTDCINLIVSGKQLMPQWLDMKSAKEHVNRGISKWDWAGNDDEDPDVVFAAAGDSPTLEMMAAVKMMKEFFPKLKIRVVNIVNLGKLLDKDENPNGLDKDGFRHYFTKDRPVILGFHGFPKVIHALLYQRENAGRFHVSGFKDKGTVSTPFDLRVCNQASRFHLVQTALRSVPCLADVAPFLLDYCDSKLEEHKQYIRKNGVDLPEVLSWKWEDEKHTCFK